MTYTHKVHYYETDAQGVTHHSNYIRIMEETRVYAMEQMGFSYERMEREGVYSPVMSVTCDYKRPTTFADIIEVQISVAATARLSAKLPPSTASSTAKAAPSSSQTASPNSIKH